MNNNDEMRLINIAREIVEMSDSVIGVTGKILGYGNDDFKLIKDFYESKANKVLSIPKDSVELRKLLMDYLKENNIEVHDDPTYEIEHFDPKSNENYLKNWENDDISYKSRR